MLLQERQGGARPETGNYNFIPSRFKKNKGFTIDLRNNAVNLYFPKKKH